MGVYGMLAMGFLVFVARYFIPQDRASNVAMGLSFWSLNIGLAYMLFVNLVPVGFLQFRDSLQNGYWHARSPEFYAQPLVRTLEWARLPGDLLFILGGILPIVYLTLRAFRYRNRPATVPAGASPDTFVTTPP
jgi:nitric oxide reductase subunit B